MPTLMPRFNWGDEIKNINPTLYNQLSASYSETANVLNTKPTKQSFRTDPVADSDANKAYLVGDFWINEATDTAWILTSRTTATAVTWTQIT